MRIADHGRLLYLKKALQKNSHIYESDKKFLKIIRSKVAESKRKLNPRRNSNLANTQTKIANQSHNKLNQNLLGTNSEKVLLAMMHEMHELKKRQLRMTDQLQVLNTKLTTSKEHIPEYTNTIHEENNELQPKQENKNKSLEKSSKIMIWTIAGLSVVWYAGFMNVVNLGPIREVFLGTAIGFAAGVILLHRIEKKGLE